MRKIFILTAFISLFNPVFAQDSPTTEEIEEAKDKSKGFLNELFMFKMAADVIETRQIISNNELGDSVESYMSNHDNALFFISTLDYDFFWNDVLGRKKYKVPSSNVFLESRDKFMEKHNGSSIDFDIVLTPQWENLATEDNLKDYKVEIIPGNYLKLDFAESDRTKFRDVMNSHFSENVATPKLAPVNEAVFDGLKTLRTLLEKSTLSPDDIIGIQFSKKFVPNNSDEKFKLDFNLKETNLADIKKVRLEIYKKGDNEVLYTSIDITDLENIKYFEWDGKKKSNGETEEVNYVTYADNPLLAKVIASEGEGGKNYTVEGEFNVKGELIDVKYITSMFDLKNSEAINLEYTIEQVEDVNIQYGKYEIIDKDKNVIASGKLDVANLEDIEDGKYKKGDLTWPKTDEINNFISKVSEEKNPYQVVLTVSENEEFSQVSTYNGLANTEVMPEIVEITKYDEEFASLLIPLADEGFKIEYEVKDLSKYEIKYAKMEVYKPNSTTPCFVKKLLNNGTKINSEDQLTENEFKGKFIWDGKMSEGGDAGKFIERFYNNNFEEENPFKVIISASKTEDYKKNYKAMVNANVDMYSKEWNAYPQMHIYVELLSKYPEKNRYKRYTTLREKYKSDITRKGIDLTNSSPIEYLANNTESYVFLNQNIRVHKNFKPILQDVESQLSDLYSQDGHYKDKIGHLSIRLIRDETSTSISNHGFGFALDIDANNNPYMTGKDCESFCQFVELTTGISMYNKLLTAEETMIANEALINKFTEISLSELFSHLNIVKTNIVDGPISIVDINSQDFHIWSNDIYNAYETLLLKAKQNNASVSECTALRKLIDDYYEKLVKIQDDLEAYKKGLFLTEVSDGVVEENAYDEFNYFKEYVDEISDDFISIEGIVDKINLSISNQTSFAVADYPSDDLISYVDFNEAKMNTLIEKIEIKLNILGGKDNIKEFVVDYLSNNFNSGHNLNDLIVNGFLGLETELINSILYKNSSYGQGVRRIGIKWGGEYEKIKDWMHFEIEKRYQIF